MGCHSVWSVTDDDEVVHHSDSKVCCFFVIDRLCCVYVLLLQLSLLFAWNVQKKMKKLELIRSEIQFLEKDFLQHRNEDIFMCCCCYCCT